MKAAAGVAYCDIYQQATPAGTTTTAAFAARKKSLHARRLLSCFAGLKIANHARSPFAAARGLESVAFVLRERGEPMKCRRQ